MGLVAPRLSSCVVRGMIRRWTPGRLKDVYRALRGRLRPIWSGVYASYRDVPVSGPGFDGSGWTRITRENTEAARRAVTSGRGSGTAGDRAQLPALAARVAAVQEEVGDFGGARTTVFALEPQVVLAVDITGATDVPDGDPKLDGEAKLGRGPIVNRGSTISPKVFELLVETAEAEGIAYAVNVSAGEIPTYATAQLNLTGSVLAYWFLGLDDLTEVLRGEGYELRSSAPSERRLTGFAVPKTHRIGRGMNLLFARRS